MSSGSNALETGPEALSCFPTVLQHGVGGDDPVDERVHGMYKKVSHVGEATSRIEKQMSFCVHKCKMNANFIVSVWLFCLLSLSCAFRLSFHVVSCPLL